MDYNAPVNIEKMLAIENQEKKRTGRGIFNRAATRKGGCKGAVRTAVDLMARQSRKDYVKAGEVVTKMYMYSIEELEAMSPKDAREALMKMRDNYANEEICKAWGLKHIDYYVKKYNAQKYRIGENKKPLALVPPVIEEKDGFTMSYKGEYTAVAIQEKLMALAQLCVGSTYKVNIKIEEVE